MIISPNNRLVACALAAVALSGCADSGLQEVEQWMAQTKSQTRVSIPKLSEPKQFTPFMYSAKDSADPYDSAKLAVAFAKLQNNSKTGIKPDLDRRREPLEAYPLDTIKMVGTLQKPGLSYALLQVDKAIFQIKIGNYVGNNLGMVTKVTDYGVELKEIVQDASGDWVERNAKLELQETKQ
jgi:type IV pilus assembly protein PilP